MSYAVLEEKIKRIPEADFEFVSNFLDLVLLKISTENSENINEEKSVVRRTPGTAVGSFWMADDFDETPDCFKDYV